MVRTQKLFWTLFLVLTIGALSASAGKQIADLPVTSTLSDADGTGLAYSVQSDGAGSYRNGVSGVESVLQGVSQNGISGDWILNTFNSNFSASSGRNALITLADAVQPGEPGYTVPANPPFWGTQLKPVRFISKCSSAPYYISTKTIKPGFPAYCPLLLRFGPSFGKNGGNYYRLDMVHSGSNENETQDVRISCNAVDASGNCNDWSLDSTPPDSQGGGTRVRARLNLVGSPSTNLGDFYLTFHIRITNP